MTQYFSEESENSNPGSSKKISLDTLKGGVTYLLPEVVPSQTHSVLFKLPVSPGKIPEPYKKNNDENEFHVVMSYSSNNLIGLNGVLKPKWLLVKDALKKPILTTKELQEAIYSYSGLPSQRLKPFTTLHTLFSEVLDEADVDYFFESLLPKIFDLALSIEELIPSAIPLLRQRCSGAVSLTQQQISCLLANAFICTFPNARQSHLLPYINFDRLFSSNHKHVIEKLKCLINYFRRVCFSTPTGVVTFVRRFVPKNKLPCWSQSEKLISDMYISSNGTIEDEGCGMMEVDFANKMVGGGVLGWGCVQEEIKFLMCPELIAARLITERLEEDEALIVVGFERYNKYSGYAQSFKWAGDYRDFGSRDLYGRKLSVTVAIDAIHFKTSQVQYKPECMLREVNKAYSGFSFGSDLGWGINVATGNWGCGAFKGDPKLKALIQLLAASESNKKLAYFTFQDEELKNSISEIHNLMQEHKITVGNLWNALQCYNSRSTDTGDVPLYDFLFSYLCYNSKTDGKVDSSYGEHSNANATKSKINNPLPSEDASDVAGNDSDIDMFDLCPEPSKEPIKASSISLSTEEGRSICLKTENDQWKSYQSMKNMSSRTTSEPPRKGKKITDYFSKV